MFGKEYRAVFKKKRQRFIIVIATMVIVTIVSVIGLALFQWPEEILEVAMLIPLVGGVVWLLFDWRCPQCSKSFIRESNPILQWLRAPGEGVIGVENLISSQSAQAGG